MIRRIVIGTSAAALAVAGLAAVGVGTAGAAPKPIIQSVSSGHVTCHISAKAKIAPALKNNWVKADHQGDTFGGPTFPVRALPDAQFASTTPVQTSAKAKSIDCSGSVSGTGVNGPGTATVTGIKITLTQVSNSVDNPPLNTAGSTCLGLVAGTDEGDQAATYSSLVSFKTSGAKIDPTTTTGDTITPVVDVNGVGFSISGGTVTGSWAGGSGGSTAYVGPEVLAAVGAPAATGAAPNPNPTCQANLKLKAATSKKAASASLKGPKGLKKIATLPSSTFTLDK
jgi:hypothetical protein